MTANERAAVTFSAILEAMATLTILPSEELNRDRLLTLISEAQWGAEPHEIDFLGAMARFVNITRPEHS